MSVPKNWLLGELYPRELIVHQQIYRPSGSISNLVSMTSFCSNLHRVTKQFYMIFLSILSVHDDGYFERTWWRLFWAYLMKVILSVPDEGYFERTWWRLFWAYPMKVILSVPDEGYSRNASCAQNFISTLLFTNID
jgi:hypothetical protein